MSPVVSNSTTIAICLPTAAGGMCIRAVKALSSPRASNWITRSRGCVVRSSTMRASVPMAGISWSAIDGTAATLVPLRLGTKPVGLLATEGAQLDLGTLDALGGVVAIAIERAHFLAERKRAETVSQRADLASALLASFSHDLRTPVTAVRAAVSNLQDAALAPEERRTQAQLALQELDRLTRLFQDILDMARIDAAAVNPDRHWVSPADVVDAAAAHVAPAVAEHSLQIDADDRDARSKSILG